MATLACTTDELLAVMNGENLETYREKKKLRQEIASVSTQYIGRHSSTWPALTFNWDMSPESQRYSMDGVSQSQFEQSYPQGFLSAWVNLDEFDALLCKASKRNGETEVWGLGEKSKLAFLIEYLSRGLPITPPKIAVTPTKEFHLQGGNHRYIAAKASGEKSLPIYMEPETVAAVRALVTLRDCP